MPKIPLGAPVEQYIAESLLKIGKGLFGATKKPFNKEFWVNPQKIGTTSAVSGRKIKDGIKLEETPGYKSGDKIVGSRSTKNPDGTEKDITHYIRSPNGSMRQINIENGKAVDSGFGPNSAKVMFESGIKSGDVQKAPWHYSTQAPTKKAYLATGALGYGGYEGYKYLNSDSNNESEPAKAQNSETASNTEDDSKNGNGFGIANAEPAGLFKSGVNKPDTASTTSAQPPKAKTNVKPKKSPKLNYDPMAEWAKADQATNDKWLKRQADYKKLVSEGVDPYDAYDRTVNLYN